MGGKTPLSPAPSAVERIWTEQITEAATKPSNIQHGIPAAAHDDFHGEAQSKSAHHAHVEDIDFATLCRGGVYSTPKQDLQNVSYSDHEKHVSKNGRFASVQGNWEPSRDLAVSDYTAIPTDTRHGASAHISCMPEALPPFPGQPNDAATRGGRNLRKRPSPSKPNAQKPSKKRKVQDASTILPRPLSEIAKEFPDIPVMDIAAFATRSTAERHGSSTADGKIKRPLNAFMLYRKAYQKVAMAYCGSSSHQTVSLACGASWRCMEPDHIRKRFKDLADTETTKHKEAHPTYKYVPKKSGAEADAGPVNPWDVDDDEYNGARGASRRATRAKKPKIEHMADDPSAMFQDGYRDPVDLGSLGQIMPHEVGPYWTNLPPPPPLHTPYPPLPFSYTNPLMYHQPDAGFWEGSLANSILAVVPSWPDPSTSSIAGCVDPRLAFDDLPHGQSDGPFQGSAVPVVDDRQRMTCPIPDLDENGAHNAYLRGTLDDWQIEPLEGHDHSDHFYEATYAEGWNDSNEAATFTG